MACFTVPAAEAVITTIAAKVLKTKESKEASSDTLCTHEDRIPFSKKLGWLNSMLWGGSALLAFEHLWHGEISLTFPFLTALSDAESTSVMLHEMSTAGVGMALTVTCVWAVMASAAEKRGAHKPAQTVSAEESGV